MKKVYLIYGITDCPSCLHAQATLMNLGEEYVFIQTDFSKSYMKAIKEDYRWDTFPIIVSVSDEEETLIGGFDELLLSLKQETTACNCIKCTSARNKTFEDAKESTDQQAAPDKPGD